MKHSRKWYLLPLCLILLFCLPLQAFADGRIDPEREASLTIHFAYEGTDIPNTEFRLFYLAQVDDVINFTLTDRFSRYPISVDIQTTEGWNELAQTLKGYVLADGLTPDYAGSTSENGVLSFDHLKTGLYFVLGSKVSFGDYIYTIEPTIICLPNLIADQWDYAPTILPKSTRKQEPVPVTEIKVVKAWEDEGAERNRPDKITVNLLKDDRVYDTVTLSRANNWRYTWTELPELDDNKLPIDWSVSEAPVKNYRTRIQCNGNVFVIINKYNGSVPPGPPLPQTGMLWWPIPVLAFSGLCCIAIGVLISRRKNHE